VIARSLDQLLSVPPSRSNPCLTSRSYTCASVMKAVEIGTGQRVVTLCGWEGKPRPGKAYCATVCLMHVRVSTRFFFIVRAYVSAKRPLPLPRNPRTATVPTVHGDNGTVVALLSAFHYHVKYCRHWFTLAICRAICGRNESKLFTSNRANFNSTGVTFLFVCLSVCLPIFRTFSCYRCVLLVK